jgi:hypothetical protein
VDDFLEGCFGLGLLLDDCLDLVLLVVKVLDLADVVLLGVGEYLEQVLWLESYNQVHSICFTNLLQTNPTHILSHKNNLLTISNLPTKRFPIPLLIIKRVNKLFIRLEVIQRLPPLRYHIIQLLSLRLQRIQLRHQPLLHLQLILH